ncbi:hypothetical protein OAN24_01665 [Pseudodesulfovibrio sp.]|nr:hypothetical protein [Pseudodesulfovibrio sp.]
MPSLLEYTKQFPASAPDLMAGSMYVRYFGNGDLGTACRRVEKDYFFIGLLEEFNLSWAITRHFLGLALKDIPGKANVATFRQAEPDEAEARALFEELHWQEHVFYQHVKELFHQRVAQLPNLPPPSTEERLNWETPTKKKILRTLIEGSQDDALDLLLQQPDPSDGELKQIADFYLQRNEREKARTYLRRVLSMSGECFLEGYLDILSGHDEPAKAGLLTEVRRQLEPMPPAVQKEMRSYLNSQWNTSVDEREKHTLSMVQIDSFSALLAGKGEFTYCLRLIEEAMLLAPLFNPVRILWTRFQVMNALGDEAGMQETIHMLKEIGPVEPHLLKPAIIWLLRNGLHNWAIPLIENAKKASLTIRDKQSCMEMEAEILLATKNRDKAIKCLLAAHNLDNSNWSVSQGLVAHLRQQGQSRQALDIIEKSIDQFKTGKGQKLQGAYCSMYREYVITALACGKTAQADAFRREHSFSRCLETYMASKASVGATLVSIDDIQGDICLFRSGPMPLAERLIPILEERKAGNLDLLIQHGIPIPNSLASQCRTVLTMLSGPFVFPGSVSDLHPVLDQGHYDAVIILMGSFTPLAYSEYYKLVRSMDVDTLYIYPLEHLLDEGMESYVLSVKSLLNSESSKNAE